MISTYYYSMGSVALFDHSLPSTTNLYKTQKLLFSALSLTMSKITPNALKQLLCVGVQYFPVR
jgi:hypothetical protein